MNIKHISTILGIALLAGTASAQYGLIENHQGTDRFGFDVNVTEGSSGFFAFGGAGGGGGQLADSGPNGVGDGAFDGGAGGDLGAGGIGYGIGFSDPIDRTAVINGMTSTGYTLDFRDGQNDGDTYFFRVESGGFNRSETFQFADNATSTSLPNGWSRLTFTPGAGVVDTGGGAFDQTALSTFVIGASTFNGITTGDANFRFDNIGFIGNLIPTAGLISDFSEQTAGSVTIVDSDAGVPLPVANSFGGTLEPFSFGDGEVTAIDVIDQGGGDNALQVTLANDTASGAAGFGGAGILFDMGPSTGSQTDVQAFDALSIDLALSDAGDTVDVLVEDINAPTFADRCSVTPAVTSTLTNFIIPFSSFTCGAQGAITSNQDAINRVTLILNNDGGNGTTLTVDNVSFINTVTGVQEWVQFQ